ncbi:MAG: hypothetical protein ACXIVF_06730 [Rhizobiaceae bacterium]
MADFVAVLRKTIGGLEDNTPEAREKVFAKARNAIDNKLASMDPPPPQVVADRQRKALEDAIVAVRAEYEPPVEDSFEDFLGAFDADEGTADPQEPVDDAPAVPPMAPEPALPSAAPSEQERRETLVDPVLDEPSAGAPADEPIIDDNEALVVAPGDSGRDGDVAAEPAERPTDEGTAAAAPVAAPRPAGSRRRRTGTLAIAAALILLIGAGAYAYWLNPDRVTALFGTSTPVETVETGEDLDVVGEDEAAAVEAAEADETAGEMAAEPEKFTQRLLPDGTEVDEGPADEQRRIGEGTSVASSTGTSDDQPASGPTTSGQVPVGQRAIFYEQTTSSAEGSAETGSIVWSLVQESPGGDAPPEPAIRGEVTIPGHSLQLRMTIRRNADQTLPAAHIMEMIFLTPENFAGGAIDSVLRVAMKDTEEETGSPLMGIPAKIADGFFLFALSDSSSEIEANVDLLRNQSWIDVPIIYRSGRRALMTMEKGLTGERIFEEAIDAWQSQTSG